MTFQIRLAGKTIEIQSLYDRVHRLCRDYLVTGEQPDCRICITQQDIDEERQKSLAEGDTYRHSDDYLEELAVYRQMAEKLLADGIWLMHGAVFGLGENAYMFTAASGTGKTTLTRLLLRINEAAFVVNGDKPLLAAKEDRILVCGTPWSGKEHMNRNCALPLKRIVILDRGDTNKLETLTFSQAFPRLLQQTYRPADAALMQKTLKLLAEMGKQVSFCRLTLKRYDRASQLENEEVIALLEQAIGKDGAAE